MKILIFGGNGFLGKAITETLLGANFNVKVFARTQPKNIPLQSPENYSFQQGSILNINDLEQAIKGADVVINLVGLLFEKGEANFENIHTKAAENIATIAKKYGVAQLIQVSSLGVDKALTSKYSQTKLAGEQAVLRAFSSATIIRPSIIFGANDNFYNQFAHLSKIMPYLPLIGGGHTKFQPVYVNDIAQAVLKIISDANLQGKIYELGGRNIYSFKQILQYILQLKNRKRLLLNIPFSVAKLAAIPTEFLPRPILTRDQVESLKYDNVLSGDYSGFAELGITPKIPEEVVPSYL